MGVLYIGARSPDSNSTSAFQPLANDPVTAVPLYYDAGKLEHKSGNFERAISNFEYCIQHLDAAQGDAERGRILHAAALSYYSLADFARSLSYLLRAATFLSPGANDSLKASVLDWTSVMYVNLGDHERSLEYQFQAVRMRQSLGDSIGLAGSFYTLADLYSRQENLTEAIGYFKRSLEIAQSFNDSSLQYSCYASLANFYEEMDSLELCYEYSQKALSLADELDYNYGRAYANNTMGNYFMKLEQPDSALGYFHKALELGEALPYKSEKCVALMGLAKISMHAGNYSQADGYLHEALETSLKFDETVTRIDIYAALSDLYKARGNFKKALEYQELSHALKDSVLSEDAKFSMSNLKASFETEQEVASIREEKDAALLAHQKRLVQAYKFGIVAGLFLISIVGWLAYTRYQSKKKTLKLISGQNKVIHAQNEQLKRYNDDLEHFAYATSHDLRDPLSQISMMGTVIREAAAHKRYDDMQKCADIMANSATRMLSMLTSLYRYARLDDKSKAIMPVEMKEVVDYAIENLNGSVEEHHAQIRIGDLPRVSAVKEHMVLLFQNLLGNGIKYNPNPTPIIDVDCVRQNGDYRFCVSDNGPGIDPKYHKHIFGMFNRVTNGADVQGSGMGLALCKRVVQLHNGRMWVESDVGKGSRFYFTIPAKEEQPVL